MRRRLVRFWALAPVMLFWLAWSPSSTDPQTPDGTPVWVFDHGWHAGVVVERATLEAHAGPVGQGWLADFPDADWFEIGWGDRGFYYEAGGLADVTVPLAAKALLWPTDSVMHVATGRGDPEWVFEGSTSARFSLDDGATARLVAAMEAGSAGGAALGPGLYGTSLFYPGLGRYHLFRTCNDWVAGVLRAAGIGVSRALSTHSGPLVWELNRRHGNGVI
ncbi:DUF2459 domain-containing protein [Aliiroseovarius sp.]|uniref:DUF2459 domain-containing protein n=1 Tax=Aliiroseovarius sp. TaxID=1872442 RepID=UPI003BAD5414